MQLKFFMCSNFHGKTDVIHLVKIMQENNLVLGWTHAKTADGKLGLIPYRGEISDLVEDAYTNEEFVDASELISSSGPRFRFEAITGLKYPEPDVPRFDYVTVSCTGHMQGRNYNSITTLINFNTFTYPDIESPYFEEGAQLMVKLGLDLYEYLKPWYGWLDYPPYEFLAREAIRDRRELDTLYWVNFLGPQYVEKYSSSFFLSSPCWRKKQLSDGGIYLQLSEFFTKPPNEIDKIKLRDYFSSSGITVSSENPFEENY